MRLQRLRRLTITGCVGVVAILATACGGGGTSQASPSPVTVPSDLSISSFDVNFTYMPKLKDLVTAGHGMVGVVLPDTTTSARYIAYDLPFLKQAFTGAGYSSTQFKIDNAQGQEQQELALAQADITAGATVLIMDPQNSSVGSAIQAYAQSHGVKIISYDRATFTGTNTYYVSFDNVNVGKLIGKGFMDCVTAWGVKNPKVFTLNGGEDTGPIRTEGSTQLFGFDVELETLDCEFVAHRWHSRKLVPSFVQPGVNPGEPLMAPIHPKRRSLPITSCPAGKVMTS